MKTVKLYDENSYLSEFSGVVISSENIDGKWSVVLDKTAFFPESGGQTCDTGVINDANVTDVKISDGVIYHTVDKEFSVGNTVIGKIDFEERFRKMQNHTGEHVVSGLMNTLYGLDNVGFHLGKDYMTADFNGKLTREQIDYIEDLANIAIYKNAKVKTFYPDINELSDYEYRSKDGVEGDIRLVKIEGYDLCACCAPHVKECGQIGIIKLLDLETLRGGTRVYIKCGSDALNDYREKYKNILRISAALSSTQKETADSVDALISEKGQIERQLKNVIAEKLICSAMNTENKDGLKIFRHENSEMSELLTVSNSMLDSNTVVSAAICFDGRLSTFSILAGDNDISRILDILRKEYNAKCGGKAGMIQGKAEISLEKITDILHEYVKSIKNR